MSIPSSSHQDSLHYRLRHHSQGVRLDIWEVTPAPAPGESPYRFFVTYQLASEAEAQQILQRYLIENNVPHAVPTQQDAVAFHLTTLNHPYG